MSSDFVAHEALPSNPRVNFLLNQRADLKGWAAIPLYAGLIAAPLYDHLPGIQEAGIIIGLIAASLLWARYFERWIEKRAGIFRERFAYPARSPSRAFLPEARVWGALLVITASIIFLRRNSSPYSPNGWMERSAGVLIVMTILLCLRRSFDKTNLRRRRLWNGIAAGVLAAGWSFEGTSPQSYAALLVLLGSTHLALALLDVGLLLHLAGKQGSLA